jgi:hypothetical protein
MRCVFALIVSTVLVANCSRHYDASDYTLGPTLVDGIIELTADHPSVQADGISTVTLTARINAASSKRNVAFAATDGTFTVGAQTDTKTAIVAADANGVAVTELRSTTTVGTVKVDAVLQLDANSSFRKTLDIKFDVPTADNVLTLVADSSTLAADGFSRTQLTGTMKLGGGTALQRQITFKSSEGLLYAFGKTADRELTVPVSADGIAIVQLESTKNVRAAHVTATAGSVTREVVVNQVAVDTTSIISVTTSSATAPADGKSLTHVIARISPALPEGRRRVVFSVTPPNTATISPSEQVADAGNQAFADVTSPKTTGPIRITAIVDNTSSQTTIEMVPALPDRILLSASSPTVQARATDSIVITATLQRDVGDVSFGTNVIFTASDPNGTFAKSSVSDANGTATASYFPGTATAPGPVTITARVPGAAAAGTIRIVVTP